MKTNYILVLCILTGIFQNSSSLPLVCKNYCSSNKGEVCGEGCCHKGHCTENQCGDPLVLPNWFNFGCPFVRYSNRGKCLTCDPQNKKTINAYLCEICPKCSIPKDCFECQVASRGKGENIVCNCANKDCLDYSLPVETMHCGCKDTHHGIKLCSFFGDWKEFPDDCSFCQVYNFGGVEQAECRCKKDHCLPPSNSPITKFTSLNKNNGVCKSCKKDGLAHICEFCSDCTVPLNCNDCFLESTALNPIKRCKCPDDSCVKEQILGVMSHLENGALTLNNGICESCVRTIDNKYLCDFCSSCSFNLGCKNCKVILKGGVEKINCECEKPVCLTHVNKSLAFNSCECSPTGEDYQLCRFDGSWQTYPSDCFECKGFGELKDDLTTMCKCSKSHCNK